MKRTLIVIFLVLLTLSGCSENNKISIGDSMSKINNNQTPFITLNSLTVFQEDNIYTVIISENGTVQKKVEFSSDRKNQNTQGLTLLKIKNTSQYLGKNIDELKAELGEFHADIGSGFYIPSYIAEDGYLICFQLENNTVFEVKKRDLFTNSIVEHFVIEDIMIMRRDYII